MGKTYLQGEILTAVDLNASFSETVNTTGTFTFTGQHTFNSAVTLGAAAPLSSSATITTSSSISDSIGNVRKVPLNTQTTAYTLVATDSGKVISTNANINVPGNIFSVGDTITILNYSTTTTFTIIQGSGVTMYWAGQTTATSGNRTLSLLGLCTIICTATNQFFITGAGLK